MKYRAVAGDGLSTFSWTIADDDNREVAMLIRVTPENATKAQEDLNQLVQMMDAAGLAPEMIEMRTRLNRNGVPSVTLSWRGSVNSVMQVEKLMNRTAELWQEPKTAQGQIIDGA